MIAGWRRNKMITQPLLLLALINSKLSVKLSLSQSYDQPCETDDSSQEQNCAELTSQCNPHPSLTGTLLPLTAVGPAERTAGAGTRSCPLSEGE